MVEDMSETIAGIKLRRDKPTKVAMSRLFSWVIWQFPVPQKKGYRGAVRPPLAECDWIPAVIYAEKNAVKIYANAGQTYSTPEAALQYFQDNNKS